MPNTTCNAYAYTYITLRHSSIFRSSPANEIRKEIPLQTNSILSSLHELV